MFPYLWNQRGTILSLTLRHLLLVGVSLAAAIAVALPLGLALERRRRAAESVIRGVGVLQTLPSIALLAFMIPLLGIGVIPALVALFLYSLYPILRNTYTGVRDAAPEAVGAAWALGMTPGQVLRYVRLPLAAPVIMAGIRTAAVINVGTATLAAFIGAGGLGDPIAAGLALSDTRMILSGALPAALLALLVDGVLGASRALRGARAIVSSFTQVRDPVRLHPFDAVRPKSELAPQVAAVPYDVVNRDEAGELAQGNPHSFLHVGRSDIDLPADVDPHDPRIYRTAREALDRFVAQGVLVREGAPALYPLPPDHERPGPDRPGGLRTHR